MKMKRVMKKIKYCVLFVITSVCLVLLTSCPNTFITEDVHKPVDAGYGRISVSLVGGGQAHTILSSIAGSGPMRTVLPSSAFTKYEYTFTRTGGSPVELAPDNNGFFTLEVGNYTVTVNAYIGNVGSHILVATGTSLQFNVGSGNNTSVDVFLSSVDTGAKGTFTYTITYPAGTIADITLQKWPEMNDIVLNPVTQGNEKNQTLQLDAGSYLLTMLISKDGFYAGISEAIHIYPSLTAEYIKVFVDGDLLPSPVITINTHPDSRSMRVGRIEGSFLTVTASSTQSAPLSYQWFSNTSNSNVGGTAIPDETNSSFTIPAGLAVGTYFYFAEVRASGGAIPVRSNVATVTIISHSVGLAFNLINNGTAYSVSLGTATDVDVIIPAVYNNLPVTDISDNGFYDYWHMTSVTIPDSVTRIGNSAFRDCISLTSVTIPDSVEWLGSSAFRGCISLTSVTIIGNSITMIRDTVFEGCSSLISITIPDSVTWIGDWAFSFCSSLTSIMIPNGVTYIGQGAFRYCTSLTSITIPSSVTNIGMGAFAMWESSQTIFIQGRSSPPTDYSWHAWDSLNGATVLWNQ
jgi:hypothetical protein